MKKIKHKHQLVICKVILFLLLYLCMSVIPFLKVEAKSSDFEIADGVLVKYHGDGGDVIIPKGTISIGISAFEGCDGLKSVVIPDGVTSIGSYAFSYCSKLKSVKIPESITSIGTDAFSKTPWFSGLKKKNTVVIVNGVLLDGKGSSGNVKIPDNVVVIADHSFDGCKKIKSITMPNSVKHIGNSAFNGCITLKKVTISNSVLSIGKNAFKNCYGLTSVTIPKSVEYIDTEAFYGIASLANVYILGNETKFYGIVFSYFSNYTLHVPIDSWAQSYAKDRDIPYTHFNIDKVSLYTNGASQSLSLIEVDPSVVTWKSSNTDIATVDPKGVVTPIKEGTVIITANADGHAYTCKVTVLGSLAKPTAKPTPKPTTKPKPTIKPTPTLKPKYKNVGYSNKTIEIAGAKFPILNGFASDKIYSENYFGGETKDNFIVGYVLEQLEPYFLKVLPPNGGCFFIPGHSIWYSADRTGNFPITLSKNSKEGYYEIKLSISLRDPGDDFIFPGLLDENTAQANRDALLALCTVISSTPERLFDAIYDSWSLNEEYGINTKTWTTIGDAQVKYKKGGFYLIKANPNSVATVIPDPYSDKTILVGNTKLPVLKEFATNKLVNKHWGGDTEDHLMVKKTLEGMTELKKGYSSNNAGLYVSKDKIILTPDGSKEDMTEEITLSKKENREYYELVIREELEDPDEDFYEPGHYTEVIAQGRRDALLAICTVISSTPEAIYDAIYASYILQDSVGNTDLTWVTVGDAQILFAGDGYYYIKAKD